MAEKRPLCNYSGVPEELRSGDTLPGSTSLWTGIDHTTLSSDANYAQTGLSAGRYILCWRNTIPATDLVYPIIEVTDDSGSNWKTSSYINTGIATYNGGSHTPAVRTDAISVMPYHTNYRIGSASGEHGITGWAIFDNIGDSSYKLLGHLHCGGWLGNGYYGSYAHDFFYLGTGIDGFRMRWSSGNHESGMVDFYKLADAA